MSDDDDDPIPAPPDEFLSESGSSAGEGESEGAGHPVLDGLLSTEPDQSAATLAADMDVSTPVAHAIVGGKKFLNGMIGAGVRTGTTAAENFVAAGVGLALADRGDDDGDGDGGSSIDFEAGDAPPEAL